MPNLPDIDDITLKDNRRMPMQLDFDLDDMSLSSEAYRVYIHLIRRSSAKGYCWPGIKTMGQHCFPKLSEDRSKRVVIETIRELEEFGLIRIEHRQYKSHVYWINDKSKWKNNEVIESLEKESSVKNNTGVKNNTTPRLTGVKNNTTTGVKNNTLRSKSLRSKKGLKIQKICTPPSSNESGTHISKISETNVFEREKYKDPLVEEWISWTTENHSHIKLDAQKCSKELEKVRKHLDADDMFMNNLLKFIQQDEFWSKNALSPCGLMTKSKNGLRKVDNIVSKMKSSSSFKTKMMQQHFKNLPSIDEIDWETGGKIK